MARLSVSSASQAVAPSSIGRRNGISALLFSHVAERHRYDGLWSTRYYRTFPPTMKAGSSNVVGRAQLNPMPRSHDTSTMTLPGRKEARSVVFRYTSGLAG